MSELNNTIKIGLISGILFLMLSGCEGEGPAERAGKKVDNAIENVGEEIREANDSNMNDGPAENFGEKIDESVENASKKFDETVDNVGEKLEEIGDSMQDK